jgi:hypothetical protein
MAPLVPRYIVVPMRPSVETLLGEIQEGAAPVCIVQQAQMSAVILLLGIPLLVPEVLHTSPLVSQ